MVFSFVIDNIILIDYFLYEINIASSKLKNI